MFVSPHFPPLRKKHIPKLRESNQIFVHLQGSKSTSYVQNGFQLFIPILQVGAV